LGIKDNLTHKVNLQDIENQIHYELKNWFLVKRKKDVNNFDDYFQNHYFP